jgi:leucyl/phenylalanyl-tRNA--protein transferase
MAIFEFPDISLAREDGLLAVGGDLEISSLLLAYSQGIFPWPISPRYPLAWFSPNPRGIIDFNQMHIPKSLKKFLLRKDYRVTTNQKFKEVIIECANLNNRKNQKETWITSDLIEGYIRLQQQKYAYSLEINKGNELVAGIYGVNIGGFYSAESMFTKLNNHSKIALIELITLLKSIGVTWLDTQMTTPVVHQLGGREIPRNYFISLLKLSLNQASLFPTIT